MGDSESSAGRSRESSPSFTVHGPDLPAGRSRESSLSFSIYVPEPHVSPPISPNVYNANEQNGILNHSHDQTDQARTYLRNFWSDDPHSSEPVEFRIPYLSWSGLCEDPELVLHKLKISYDSLTSVLSIFPMENERHNYTLQWLNKLAISASQNLDVSISRKFLSTQNIRFDNFGEKWAGSFNKLDFAIVWENDTGDTDIHTIIEVGVSQSKNQLRKVMKTYFERAPQISRVILIDVIETPKYVQPENFDIDQLKNVKTTEFRIDSEQGPVWYKGIQWIGHNTISWEVWERDLKSGDPIQIFEATIIPNASGSELPFFKIPTKIADNIEPVTVKPADIDRLRLLLRMAIRDEAKWRIGKYVKDRRHKANETANLARQKEEADKTKQKANEERAKRAQRRRRGD